MSKYLKQLFIDLKNTMINLNEIWLNHVFFITRYQK